MRIEKITENTIKVTLAAQDFANRGIEISKLKFNSPACQELLWDIIDHAEIEMGLDGLGDRVIVETVADSQGNCVITVTRSESPAPAPAVPEKPHYEPNEADELLNAILQAPTPLPNARYTGYLVLHFPDFEALIDAVSHCANPKAIPSKLYTYQGSYYLILSLSGRNFYPVLRFEAACMEFGGEKVSADNAIPILQEHGKPLMRRNAIASLIQKFVK